ncbi:type II toxin-antitoxin system RelE family toxin [Nostoc sp.]|uniref:type II toxin-antitoxin system RelE family toxin n=1 Tax=Nostoc sp. TaxID=1180 RepID=UPI003FA5A863
MQAKLYKQVVSKILSLQGNSQPQDCKALKGYEGGYRVGQGEYRILYTIDEESKLIDVFRVGKRNDGEVYKRMSEKFFCIHLTLGDPPKSPFLRGTLRLLFPLF